MLGAVRSSVVGLVFLILTRHPYSVTFGLLPPRAYKTVIPDADTPTQGYTTERADKRESQNADDELDYLYQKVVEDWEFGVNTTFTACDANYIIFDVLQWRYLHYTTVFAFRGCENTWELVNFPYQGKLMVFIVTVARKLSDDRSECSYYTMFSRGLSDTNTNVKQCGGTKGFVHEVTSSTVVMLIWSASSWENDDRTYIYFFMKDRIEPSTESTSLLISTKQPDLDQSSVPATVDPCQMRNTCPDTHECTLNNAGEYQCLCTTGLCEETDNTVITLSTAMPGVIVFAVIFALGCRKIRKRRVFKRKDRKIERFWAGTISNGQSTIKKKIKIPSLSPILTTILQKDVQLQLTPLLISPEKIQLLEELGRGAFGTVCKGFYNPDENLKHVQTVAIKALSDKCIGTDINAFVNEALTMAEFNHCHVMSIIGVCINPQTDDPMIVLPFMENGDLKTYLRKFRYEKKDIEPPDENQLLMFCLHIARGMDYLSGLRFVHRDLAARNCMMDSNLVVKVADFGLTREVYTEAFYRQDQQKLLPVKWMAIESLRDRVYTTYTDIWSFGVTMWEVLTMAMLPYPELDNADVINHLKAGSRMEPPEMCPEELHPLMTSCWKEKPVDRPNFLGIATQISTYLAIACDYLDLSDECKTAECSVATDGCDRSEEINGIELNMPSTSWKSAVPNIYEDGKCARE